MCCPTRDNLYKAGNVFFTYLTGGSQAARQVAVSADSISSSICCQITNSPIATSTLAKFAAIAGQGECFVMNHKIADVHGNINIMLNCINKASGISTKIGQISVETLKTCIATNNKAKAFEAVSNCTYYEHATRANFMTSLKEYCAEGQIMRVFKRIDSTMNPGFLLSSFITLTCGVEMAGSLYDAYQEPSSRTIRNCSLWTAATAIGAVASYYLKP